MNIFKIKKSEKYYNVADIDNTNALYRVIIGKRGNGKTFCLIDKCIKEFCKSGLPSVYLRRYAEDIKKTNISNLVASEHNKTIQKHTKGMYNGVVYKSGAFYFCWYNSEGTIERLDDKVFLYTLCLSGWEHVKGADRGKVAFIVFDEFCTRGDYLANEFITFANVISSLIRDRDGTIIYMLANTVNTFSPYWAEMGVYNVEKMQKGQINIYTYNDKKLTVAVEYCADSTNTKDICKYFAFDNPQLQMITNGDWEESSYRHLTERYTKEDIYFTFYICFDGHWIKGTLYKRLDNLFILYYNINKVPVDLNKIIVYTDKPIKNRFHSNSFMHCKTKKQILIKNLMLTNRDYYNNNTTGEIVNNFKKWGAKL